MSLGDWEHEPAVRQLQQDVRRGQIAHAYLLAGPATRCKQEAVSCLAQVLLCQTPAAGEACGSCDSCAAWAQRVHPDYHPLEPESGSVKIDQIRQWRSFFSYKPRLGRHQVFSLNAPELLTDAAANSLLKILEEPLPQTVFLLATEDERALLPTVVSRCRVVLFRTRQENPEPAGMEDGTVANLRRLIWEDGEAELLREVRLLKPERTAASSLLRCLLSDFEQHYRTARNQIRSGHGNTRISKGLLECLDIILTGLQLLDGNISVSLLLALTLRAL